MQAASDLLPPHNSAKVSPQRAPVQGRNAYTISMCVVPGMASHYLGRRAGHTMLLSTSASQPTFCLETCVHQLESRGVHETSSSLDMSLSTLTYRAQQTSSEQRGIHSDPVAALLQPSHAH